jgi:hypothetical protein
MGPVFVVIIWAIIGSVLAVGAGLLALVINFRKPRLLQLKRVLFAVLLPIFAIGWVGCSVVSFAVWSNLSGMHLGFGNFADFSEVPLPNGYSVWMIDTNERGSIHKGVSGAHIVAGVREIGQVDDVVFGRSDDGFFTLDTRAGDLKQGMADVEYAAALKSRGIVAPTLNAVGHFYTGRRWNPLDSGLVAFQVLSPILLVAFVWRRFMSSAKLGAAEQPAAAAGGPQLRG